ncbi:MAG TPA: type VI secretion system tube protein Hcp [Planctomycetota bacterium]|nr:type VI secretion system tube protein Hcp [Planctomycetota bacterium]
MATMNVYAQIDGMKGECGEQKHKDWCVVLGYNHRIEYAFDFREGRGKAEPDHGGITIVKPFDPASPMLAEACAKKKKVPKVVLEFMRDNPADGSSQMYFTVTIEDCRVVRINPMMADVGKEYPHVEEVAFSYRKIVWKQVPASKETQFDFQNPTG